MILTHFKKIIIGLSVGVFFASNSWAVWTKDVHSTTCAGNTCHHSSYKKQCYHGDCRVVKRSSTWHR
ncbi:hypothetical protein Lsai_2535 [Legionella sainthelensi]|uniref:Uncharacterized protein n=1 Tax=Legionella sainthelensi TaxID=28087 RepID=A0A0W0YE02_9GAMM|nr:hypothetical protein Lsai_2535 [Legionella sainthelensi]VEH36264.1 Uncharacterised protein [Legionella sainthelensi]